MKVMEITVALCVSLIPRHHIQSST